MQGAGHKGAGTIVRETFVYAKGRLEGVYFPELCPDDRTDANAEHRREAHGGAGRIRGVELPAK